MPSVFSYATKASVRTPSARKLRAIKRSRMCSTTSTCTAKPAETCEPDRDTGVIAESSAQEEAEAGEQQEATVVLDENDEQEQETEPAKNREECESEEELSTEQYCRNEEDEQDLIKLVELQEVEIGELQIENEQLIQENAKLREEVDMLRNQMFHLTHLCNSSSQSATITQQQMSSIAQQSQQKKAELTALSLKGDDKKVRFYTGLPNYEVFEKVYKLMEPLLSKDDKKSTISLFDELLMVLVKLRLGVPNQDLGYRFHVSSSWVSVVFHKWITLMSVELKCLVRWPDSIALHEHLPSTFRKHFSNVRCIIDCFEIFIERPVALHARAATYSNYKKHNTVKVFFAVSPTGSIGFISKAWSGRVSDKEITQKCGFLNLLEYGDEVLADRGFSVDDDLAVCGAKLLLPSYTKGKSQLSQKDVEQSRRLARVRIHVERVIGQMRKKYTILHNTLPVSLIKCPSDSDKTNCTIDRILIVTAALTNLSPAIIPP